MTALGVLNPNSHMKEYGRELRSDPFAAEPVRMTVDRRDLDRWAEYFAYMHQLAIFKGVDVVIRTMEENIRALVEYADELAEVGS